MTKLALPDDFTATGISQGSLFNLMSNIVDLINELQADHATARTLQVEQIADHETTKTVVDAIKVLANATRDYALNITLDDAKLVIDTNFDVKTAAAISFMIDGRIFTLATGASFDTGSSQVIATSGKWSSGLLSVQADGTKTLTWSATLDAASEAAAITALPALPASEAPVGFVTVQSDAAATWTAGTDALTTGTGGNPAQATNYYNHNNGNAATLGAAVSSSSPATLSAAAQATLANVTALVLTKG